MVEFPISGKRRRFWTEYKNTGRYDRDLANTDAQAWAYIKRRAFVVAKPAIVLDIDETSLSNWPQIAANDIAFKIDGPCNLLPKGPCGLKAWQMSGRARPLAPTLALFGAARRNGVAVFFITGRDETLRKSTERNLRKAGYEGWRELVMRPANSTTPSASDYKAPQRARIERMGYTIIANIGDQPSDLAGGHAERTWLLPNPFYRIP